jgi:hypothetical protein
MRLTNTALIPALFALAALASACGGSTTSPSTTTTTTTTTVTETLMGSVAATVDGVPQSSYGTFTVSQSGTVYLTLTSAVEAFPGGTFQTSVPMSLAIGTYADGACTVGAGTSAVVQTNVQMYTTLSAGSYCLQVSDATNQLGPVSWAVSISHP